MTRFRSSERLRTRIFWSLVAFGSAPMTAALVFSGERWLVTAAVASLAASVVLGFVTASFLVGPIYELGRRLSVKNYGEQASGFDQPKESLSLDQGGLELAEKLTSRYMEWTAMREGPLPAELQKLERLARAGRVTEMALEAVKKDMFRHLSHQLKSPMAQLRARTAAIRQHRDAGALGSMEPHLQAVDDIAMGVAALVDRMLSMAWVERLAERGPVNDKVNLSTSLMEVASKLKGIPLERDVKLTTAVESGLWVRGEKDLLKELVSALLDNAIRYSPTGGQVTLEAKQVFATKTVLVKVVDQGPGIPPSERENVFDPFYGATGVNENGAITYGTRRHRVLGEGIAKSSHGLGLSLVRSVAKLHGAQVALEVGPNGRGLSVEVLLGSTSPPAAAG